MEREMTVSDAIKAIEHAAYRAVTFENFVREIRVYLSEGETATVNSAGDTITITRVHKEGGFLGIGTKTITEPLLLVKKVGGFITAEQSDDDFLVQLTRKLIRP